MYQVHYIDEGLCTVHTEATDHVIYIVREGGLDKRRKFAQRKRAFNQLLKLTRSQAGVLKLRNSGTISIAREVSEAGLGAYRSL